MYKYKYIYIYIYFSFVKVFCVSGGGGLRQAGRLTYDTKSKWNYKKIQLEPIVSRGEGKNKTKP